MSERQEHRQRLNARIAYAAAIERWAKNQPLLDADGRSENEQ